MDQPSWWPLYSGMITLWPGDWRIRSPAGEALIRVDHQTTALLAELPWDRSQTFERLSIERTR